MRLYCWIALLVTFSPTILWSYDGWMLENGYYGHGPILTIAACMFLWWRREAFARAPRSRSRIGVVALVVCLLFHLAGQALLVDGLSGIVFVPAMLSLVLALEGPARLRVLAPALLCLAFAVPLPIFVTGKLAYALKHFATIASIALGRLLGIALEQDGARIFVPGQEVPLLVGDACSGLRSLVALVALGWVFAFFFSNRGGISRFVLVAAAVPVALFANVLRITVLALLAHSYGTEFATGTAHDVSGWLIYLAALLMLYGLDLVLPGRRGRRSVDDEVAEPSVAVAETPGAPVRSLAALISAAGVVALALAVSVPSDARERYGSRVLDKTARFQKTVEYDFPESWYDLLGTRDVCWRRYADANGGTLDVTAIFQGSTWKSLHPPEVCLQSAGYEILRSETRSAEASGERFGLTMLEAWHGREQRKFVIAYVFVGESFKTPSFLGFFLRNIPRAIFRRESRAVLLRLDVPWPEGTDKSVVEARIAAFYEDMLPALQELIRS